MRKDREGERYHRIGRIVGPIYRKSTLDEVISAEELHRRTIQRKRSKGS